MAAWSVDDLLKELADLEELQRIRPNADLLPKLLLALQHKVQAVTALTPSMLLKLTTALEASSLPADLKKGLQDSVDERAMQASAGTLQLTTKSQVLLTPWNYLSSKEWEQFKAAPQSEMVHLLVSRAKAIGVTSMKEKTKKAMLALVMHSQEVRGEPRQTPAEVYKTVGYIHRAFLLCRQHALVAGFATYPDKPSDLGVEWMRKVYHETDFPKPIPSVVATSVAALMRDAIVRNSHGDLQDTVPKTRVKGKRTLVEDDDESTMVNFCKMLKMMRSMATDMDEAKVELLGGKKPKRLSNGSSSSSSCAANGVLALEDRVPLETEPSGIDVNAKPLSTIPQPSHGPVDTPESETVEQAPAGENDAADDSLEQYEKAAFESLQNRKLQKKLAAASKGILKRPAAKKQPAAPKASVTKPTPPKPAAPKAAVVKANCWGCSRCCEKCAFDGFKGKRLCGREAWQKWHNQQKKL